MVLENSKSLKTTTNLPLQTQRPYPLDIQAIIPDAIPSASSSAATSPTDIIPISFSGIQYRNVSLGRSVPDSYNSGFNLREAFRRRFSGPAPDHPLTAQMTFDEASTRRGLYFQRRAFSLTADDDFNSFGGDSIRTLESSDTMGSTTPKYQDTPSIEGDPLNNMSLHGQFMDF